MAARQAKVSIGLDLKPLREDTRRAQEVISSLGKAKIDRSVREQVRSIFGPDLTQRAKVLKNEVREIEKALKAMGSAGQGAFSPQAVSQYVSQLSQARSMLRQVQQQQRAMASGSFGRGSPPPASGGASGGSGGGFGGPSPGGGMPGMGGGMLGRFAGGLRGGLGMLGIGLGVSAALGRSEERARAGLEVRQLTGGASVSGSSQLGFTDMERRQRALSIARGTGRDMQEGEINERVNLSEKLERGFGISGETFGGALGAAKKAGISKEDAFVADAVGDAVAMKLSGSTVGQYLEAMTGYLQSVSKGVDIKQGALRGFASALGSLDFFKKDPERIFDALGKLESLVKGGGDEFQQLATHRAIQQAGGGGMSMAGVEVRRSMGLFGGAGLSEKAEAAGMGDLASIFKTSGEDILDQFLSDAFKTATKAGGGGKKDNASALNIFQSMTGLKDQQGAEIFLGLAEAEKKGGQPRLSRGMKGKAREAMMSPEERAENTMKNFDGSVVRLSKRIDDFKNAIADLITGGVMKLVSEIDDFAKSTELFQTDVEKFALAVAAFAAGKVALGAGDALLQGAAMGMGMQAMGFLGVGAAVVGAAAAGALFGTAVREKLNEWTDGEWDKSVDAMWRKLGKMLGFDTGGDEDSDKAFGIDAARQELDKKFGREVVADAEKKTATANQDAGVVFDTERTVKELRADLEFKKERQDEYAKQGYTEAAANDEIEKELEARRASRARKAARVAKVKGEVELHKAGKTDEKQLSDDARNALEIERSGIAGLKRAQEEESSGISMTQKVRKEQMDSLGATEDPKRGDAEIYDDDGKIVGYGKSVDQMADGGRVLPFRRKFEDGGVVPAPTKKARRGKALSASVTDYASSFFGKANGGPVGINSQKGWSRGGPLGRDNIDTKMMQGEFVVNARDASRNMMALVHANAGGRITPAADGGVMGTAEEEDDGLDASSPVPMASTGQLPSNIALDSKTMEAALAGNTQAIMAFAQVLASLAQRGPGPTARVASRGSSGVRYGA